MARSLPRSPSASFGSLHIKSRSQIGLMAAFSHPAGVIYLVSGATASRTGIQARDGAARTMSVATHTCCCCRCCCCRSRQSQSGDNSSMAALRPLASSSSPRQPAIQQLDRYRRLLFVVQNRALGLRLESRPPDGISIHTHAITLVNVNVFVVVA